MTRGSLPDLGRGKRRAGRGPARSDAPAAAARAVGCRAGQAAVEAVSAGLVSARLRLATWVASS